MKNLFKKIKLWMNDGWELQTADVEATGTFSHTVKQTWKHFSTGQTKVVFHNKLNRLYR